MAFDNISRLILSYFIAAFILIPVSFLESEPDSPEEDTSKEVNTEGVEELPIDEASFNLLSLIIQMPKENFVYGMTRDSTNEHHAQGCILFIKDSANSDNIPRPYHLTRIGLKPAMRLLRYPLKKVTQQIFVNPDYARYDPKNKKLVICLGKGETMTLSFRNGDRNLWFIEEDFHDPKWCK